MHKHNQDNSLTETALRRHLELKNEIQQHDHNYYVLDQPTITDFEYDKLFSELITRSLMLFKKPIIACRCCL